MVVSELCDRAVSLITVVAKKSAKHAVEAAQLMDDITRLKGWAYPYLTTDDIVRVVRCHRCKHYKKYRLKNDRKTKPFYACSLTKIKHPEDYFCKDGAEWGNP